MKKVLALLLAMGMTLSLVACGNTAASGNTTESKPAESTAKDESKPSDSGATGESVDITMWCIATETDSNRHAYESAIADFQAAHPEVNFTWEATANEEYKTKIKAAAAANEMPDIFFTWGGGFLNELVSSDRVYCLDDVYPKYASEFPKANLVNHTFDGKLYAAPTTFNIVVMYCNMDLLKEAGYDKVPGTYDELIACCDALLAKDIIPFGCSGKETWCVTEYLESMIEKCTGSATMSDMYNGKTSWNNEGVIDAVAKFQEMISKNYFDPAGIALDHNEVKNGFLQGKYAFYINGSWICADVRNAGIEDHVQIAEFPVINSANAQLGELIGGANDSLAVAASSKNAALAAEYAMELSRSICYYGYHDGNGLPAWDLEYDLSKINPLTIAVGEIVKNAKGIVLFGDNFLRADNANTYLDYVSQIYASAIDGKGFAEGLDKDLDYSK